MKADRGRDRNEEVVFPASGVAFSRLALPDWSIVAQPTFCSGRVAYWAVKPGPGQEEEIHLQVYDIATRRVIGSAYARTESLATDSSYSLPAIEWSTSGRQVSSGGIVLRLP